ncbi:MAG TPA: hypothetical protein VH541_05750 [Gaiellaceae bacterium]|jgi:hypothetical protein
MERFTIQRCLQGGRAIEQWADDTARDIGRGDLDTALERLRRIGDEARAVKTNAEVVQHRLRDVLD